MVVVSDHWKFIPEDGGHLWFCWLMSSRFGQ